MRSNLIITRSSWLCVYCVYVRFLIILFCSPSLRRVIFVKMVPEYLFGNLLLFCLARVNVFIMNILKEISEKLNSCTSAKKKEN